MIGGPHFSGVTWAAWEAFLAALCGDAMDDAQLALYRHHTGRTEPPAAPFREGAVICGRRAGKSRILALLATWAATVPDYSSRLAPGERATVAVIASDRRQARGIFRFILGLLESVPLLAPLIESQTADSVTLSNGVTVEIHTASFRVTRGYSLAFVAADEVAFWRSEESANPDEEILAATRPGLSNLGGMLLLASSPYSKRGVLYKAFRDHYGRDGARTLVWRGTSLEMNPSLDPGVVDRAYQDDPASAAAEYGAEFRNDVSAFVMREAVDGCVVPGRYELPPLPGAHYRAFVDPSGGSADSMTLAIAHADKAISVLDAVREVRPPFSPEGVVQDFCTLLKSYRVGRVTGDRYAGEWPREQFRKQGIAYDLADKPKSDLYRDVLPLLNSGQVELLDLPRLAVQLCGLERRVARGGRDSIDHSPGAHDDVANSAAGALLLAKTRAPMVINREALARI